MSDDKSDPNRQALLHCVEENENQAEETVRNGNVPNGRHDHPEVPNGICGNSIAGSDKSKHERSKSPEKLKTVSEIINIMKNSYYYCHMFLLKQPWLCCLF